MSSSALYKLVQSRAHKNPTQSNRTQQNQTEPNKPQQNALFLKVRWWLSGHTQARNFIRHLGQPTVSSQPEAAMAFAAVPLRSLVRINKAVPLRSLVRDKALDMYLAGTVSVIFFGVPVGATLGAAFGAYCQVECFARPMIADASVAGKAGKVLGASILGAGIGATASYYAAVMLPITIPWAAMLIYQEGKQPKLKIQPKCRNKKPRAGKDRKAKQPEPVKQNATSQQAPGSPQNATSQQAPGLLQPLQQKPLQQKIWWWPFKKAPGLMQPLQQKPLQQKNWWPFKQTAAFGTGLESA